MSSWTAFAASGHFAYDKAAIKKHWKRLHACDQEPLPEEPALLQAWIQFHNGHFDEAHRAGLRLGHAGATVANRAVCVYATQLEPRESERLALFQAASVKAAVPYEV